MTLPKVNCYFSSNRHMLFFHIIFTKSAYVLHSCTIKKKKNIKKRKGKKSRPLSFNDKLEHTCSSFLSGSRELKCIWIATMSTPRSKKKIPWCRVLLRLLLFFHSPMLGFVILGALPRETAGFFCHSLAMHAAKQSRRFVY